MTSIYVDLWLLNILWGNFEITPHILLSVRGNKEPKANGSY
jgi:hypothetical protein